MGSSERLTGTGLGWYGDFDCHHALCHRSESPVFVFVFVRYGAEVVREEKWCFFLTSQKWPYYDGLGFFLGLLDYLEHIGGYKKTVLRLLRKQIQAESGSNISSSG